MNNSFDVVITSQLNNSRSKETHAFPKAKRFQQPRKSTCIRDSYDLSKLNLSASIVRKVSVTPQAKRFGDSETITPGPNTYRPMDFIQNDTLKRKGAVIGHQKRLRQQNKQLYFPGPGAYKAQNPQTSLHYTIRSRVSYQPKQNPVGPGAYHIEKVDAVGRSHQISTKYLNPQTYKIGQSARFTNKEYLTISPGPGAYENKAKFASKAKLKTQASTEYINPAFSFSRQELSTSMANIKKTFAPGPGSYYQFSQFSERRKGVMNNMQKMQSTLRMSKK